MKLIDVKLVVVPHYEQLSVRNSFHNVLRSYGGLQDYFPVYSETYIPGRKYFWEVFATLHYEDALRFIDEERNNRYAKEEEEKNRLIKIDPVIFEEIMNCKYFSKKKGRALYSHKEEKDEVDERASTATKFARPAKTKRGTQQASTKQLILSGIKNNKFDESVGHMIDMQEDTRYDDSGQKFQTPSNRGNSPFTKRSTMNMLSAGR